MTYEKINVYYRRNLFLWTPGLAQSPALLNYQGVARQSNGDPMTNQSISLRISILDGSASGTVKYKETQSVTTNDFGLYKVAIGDGHAVTGSMNAVDWGSDDKYIKVEIDPNGGSNYTDMGTTELLSVPYALYTKEAGSAKPTGSAGGDLSGTYPNPSIGNGKVTTTKINNSAVTTAKIDDGAVTKEKLDQMGASSGEVLKWDGSNWSPGTDNGGLWSQSGSTVYYNNGKVGIGTSSPANNLEVADNNSAFINIKSNGYAGVFIDRGSTTDNGYVVFRTSASSEWYVGQMGSNGNDFQISQSSSGDNAFRINQGGKVGIDIDPGASTPGFSSQMLVHAAGASNIFNMYNGTSEWGFYMAGVNLYLSHNSTTKGLFNGTSGAYTSTSDRRLKENIQPLRAILNKVEKIKIQNS